MGQAAHLTIRGAIAQIYHNEGVRGFYKGVMSPLASRTPISASLYFTQGYSYRWIESSGRDFGPVQKHAIAGACAGFVFANISFPFDLMKVKKQANLNRTGSTYRDEL